MIVTVNGRPRELPAAATVQDLLELLRMDAARVAVEHNRGIVPKACFATTTLAAGDQLEIVQFVGGG